MKKLIKDEILPKDNIFNHEIRRYIYNFVLNNPGLHLREIVRKTKIPYSTLKYHFRYLKKRGLVVDVKGRRYNRFYGVQKISDGEKKLLSIIRQNTPRKIVLFLLIQSCSSQTEISKEFNKHPTTISFHINKLLDAGIIEPALVVDGFIQTSYKKSKLLERSIEVNEKFYKLKDPYIIYDLFVTYKNVILEDGIDKKMMELFNSTIRDDPPKILKGNEPLVDSLVKHFYDVFPHPYHA